MAEVEGVIKYQLDHRGGPPPRARELSVLNAWRTVLFRLRLIGQDPARYGGLGFGNVSIKLDQFGKPTPPFIVSGTQTGSQAELDENGYCLVSYCDPARNYVVAQGPVKPSSEALTHAAVYAADTAIHCVLHVHSPDIWQAAHTLGLPATGPEVRYGTPAMAEAVAHLVTTMGPSDGGVFAMEGHEDGVVAFGVDPSVAGHKLIGLLVRAMEVRQT
ncbi:hypothetical protein CAI21_21365 [Alkalilimnicola ehrlichii]|uniref:Class II aldolase/adducin N-terminal domain-containing protein n=2 Tax=Alkalilimnicola ehrlichii TaxID=351052 RepID=A0A3E0WGS0_9GAMM|nr:hypothetical protein CAI21_21365 [Alkalilimnicola ehrlichii]RFA32180.1 hypothetical protein CAL65_20245 [Alkalilimnicola ehrlichii]